MKRILLCATAAALLAGPAIAADIPVKAPLYRVPPPVPTWTGFYIGINGGVARMAGPSMTYQDLAVNVYFPATVHPSATSGIAGFHAGYNLQATGNWLLGIEGDWDWTNLRNGASQNLVCAGPTRPQCHGVNLVFTDNAFLQTEANWLASLRGRVGYTWNQWLLYATGGVAWANLDFTTQVDCTNVAPSFCGGGAQRIHTQFSNTRVGGVVGGGVEYKPASNWIFGIEYLYYRFDHTNTAGGSWFFVNTGAPAPFFECTVPGQNCAAFTFRDFGIHAGRVRLTYRFGQEGPVSTRY
jgi:outer membrane immunogenic protein